MNLKIIALIATAGCAKSLKIIDPESCIAECIKEIDTENIEEHCEDAMKDRPCCLWGQDVMPCDVVQRILTF